MTEIQIDRDESHRISERVAHANYIYLLSGLSILLLFGPVTDQFLPRIASQTITTLSFAGALMICVWSLARSRAVFRFGLGLAIAVCVVSVVDIAAPTLDLRLISLFLLLAFLALSIWYSARDVIFGGGVDVNRLVGGMCVYLMLGLIWAVLFAFVAVVSPDAFKEAQLDASAPFWDFVYYSFVTLTTLGYGDVAPVGALARSLAYLEAVIGQLYIAVLIAGLVGTHLANGTHK